MIYSIILLISIVISLAAGIAGTYFFMRKMVPGEVIERIKRLEKSNLKMMKDMTKLWNNYRRLYGMLKKLRFDYIDEMINSKLIKEANEQMKDELFKEIGCN